MATGTTLADIAAGVGGARRQDDRRLAQEAAGPATLYRSGYRQPRSFVAADRPSPAAQLPGRSPPRRRTGGGLERTSVRPTGGDRRGRICGRRRRICMVSPPGSTSRRRALRDRERPRHPRQRSPRSGKGRRSSVPRPWTMGELFMPRRSGWCCAAGAGGASSWPSPHRRSFWSYARPGRASASSGRRFGTRRAVVIIAVFAFAPFRITPVRRQVLAVPPATMLQRILYVPASPGRS
jgi:hypothetical protein